MVCLVGEKNTCISVGEAGRMAVHREEHMDVEISAMVCLQYPRRIRASKTEVEKTAAPPARPTIHLLILPTSPIPVLGAYAYLSSALITSCTKARSFSYSTMLACTRHTQYCGLPGE